MTIEIVQAHCGQAAGTSEGALMHVEVGTIDAVVVLAASGLQSQKAALESIAAVDPSSKGVPMRQVKGLFATKK